MKFSFHNPGLVTCLQFVAILSYSSAVKSSTSSLVLTNDFRVNAKSKNTHNLNLLMESDSDDSFLPYRPHNNEQQRHQGASSILDQYPAPNAKDSKWRFDLHFAIDTEVVRPLVPYKETERSFVFGWNRALDKKKGASLSTTRTKVALRRHE